MPLNSVTYQLEAQLEHSDEVLDVCFSLDGTKAVTCSKDAYVKVWDCRRLSLVHQKNMKVICRWDMTVCARFNKTSTHLLVSGQFYGDILGAELAIFDVQDDFNMIRRVELFSFRPVFPTWLDEDTVLSPYMTKSVEGRTTIGQLKVSPDARPETCFDYDNKNDANCQWILVAEFETTEGGCKLKAHKLNIYPFGTRGDVPNAVGIKKLNVEEKDSVWRYNPDFVQDMMGHVIGACLSPDKKIVYIIYRPWRDNDTVLKTDSPVKEELVISQIDLESLTMSDSQFRSHASSAECSFSFPAASKDYIASGGQENEVCLWNRHSGALLCKLPHNKMVNCVSFDPSNQENMWTVSDDGTIRVWKLKQQCAEVQQVDWSSG